MCTFNSLPLSTTQGRTLISLVIRKFGYLYATELNELGDECQVTVKELPSLEELLECNKLEDNALATI